MTEDTYREHLTDLQLEVEELRAKLKESQTGDLISRQAAIDLIKNDAFWVQYAWGGRGHKPEMEMVDDLVESIIKQMKESVMSRLKQMPSAQPEQRWIPCSERLPKPFEHCLWTTTDGRVVYHHCDGLFSNYTAWMPLPEPYKERWEE